MTEPSAMSRLIREATACRICEANLPEGPRPVFSVSSRSAILLIGQAPGRRVHLSGVPWDDPSGDKLRDWLGVDREAFYNPANLAILPMGFCYPGKGRSGDLPPRPECAPAWHDAILAQMPDVKLTLLIGQYAQKAYLDSPRKNLTETVRAWRDYLPTTVPLPHPSPRNRFWLAKNPWFEEEVIPYLRDAVVAALDR